MDMLARRARALVLVGGFFLVAAVSHAAADTLVATHTGKLEEREHSATVSVVGDEARILVRRTVANLGKRVDEADWTINLPPAGVVQGLRVRLGKQWVHGEVLPAAQADEIYEGLTQSGGVGSRGPALLSWTELGRVRLRAFPVAAGAQLSVEYEIVAPLCYAHGKRVAFYAGVPEDDSKARAPNLRLQNPTVGRFLAPGAPSSTADDKVLRECLGQDDFGVSNRHFMLDSDRLYAFVLDEEVETHVRAKLGSHVLGAERALADLGIDVAPKLGDKPAGAQLVFLVDASYSVAASDIDAQLTLIKGYLRHFPDADFEVVVYRRAPERLVGSFAPARRAEKILSGFGHKNVVRGNGSNLDDALGFAVDLLSARRGHKRVIAFTDSVFRSTLTPQTVSAYLTGRAQVLVHVLEIGSGSDGALAWQREDEHALAEVIRGTGGMVVSIAGRGTVDEAKKALIGLDRPRVIDQLRLSAEGVWTPPEEPIPEGSGFRSMILVGRLPERPYLEGYIWGRRLHVDLVVDPMWSARLPALAMGRSIVDQLDKREIFSLANAAKVVSPETSILARDPSVPPSSYDYEEMFGTIGIGSIGSSSSCGGCIGLTGNGTVGHVEVEKYSSLLAGLVKDQVQACSALHGGVVDDLNVEVEMSYFEISDVTMSQVNELSQCVGEAIWAVELGEPFRFANGRYALRFD